MYNEVLPSSSLSLNDITALSLSTSSEKKFRQEADNIELQRCIATVKERERDRLYLVSQSKKRWWCEVGGRGRGEVGGRGRE